MITTLFADEFNVDSIDVDRTKWTTPEGNAAFFGRTAIRNPDSVPGDTDCVHVFGGAAHLLLSTYNPTANTPGDSFWGSEIDSIDEWGFVDGRVGLRYEANVRSPVEKTRGYLTSVFAYNLLHQDPALADELDWEFLSNLYQPDVVPPQALLNRYAAEPPGPGHGVFIEMEPGFDFTVFHRFAIDYYPGRVEWLVDGVVTGVATTFVPTGPLGIRLNIWAPTQDFFEAWDPNLQPTADPNANVDYDYQIDWVHVSGTDTNFGDTVQSRIGYTLPDGLHNLVLVGSNPIGGAGNALDNTITGNASANALSGNAGNDHLTGGAGGDALNGGAGFDYARYGSAHAAVIASLTSPAVNTGHAAGDTYSLIEGLVGSAFNDQLFGDGVVNDLAGLDGDDTLFGVIGNDNLQGGNGNDFLSGGAGGDRLVGGAGTDYARYNQSGAGVIADLASPNANTGEAVGDTYSTIEGLVGSSFNDQLFGDAAVNDLAGGDGDDTLSGRAGNDNLQGLNGNDTLEGGIGADRLVGGAGMDYARYKSAAGVVLADLGNAALNTGEAAGDTFVTLEGLIGSAFGDQLGGDGAANDLAGLDGNDTLLGRGGNDNLQGMNGDDSLDGGAGADRLVGGAGNDIFRFEALEANGDGIVDFNGNGAAAGDRLVFHGYGLATQGATFVQIDATHWRINSSNGAIHDVLTLTNAAPVHVSDYSFI